jgi:Fe-S cluster biogenesis protein NfuA
MMDVQIQVTPGQVETVCEFQFSRPLYDGPEFPVKSDRDAQGAPVLEALLGIAKVNQLLVTPARLVVMTDSPVDWREVAPIVGNHVRNHLDDFLPASWLETRFPPDDPEALHAQVQEVIDSQLNPGIAGHGGYIELVRIQDRVAEVVMSGGCQGCSAASQTLSMGVKRTLLQQFPQLQDVVDITDHSKGENPYYK